jgi:hypothetical protein
MNEQPRFGAYEMSRVGVTIIDHQRAVLRCDACGENWQADLGGNPARAFGFSSRINPAASVLPAGYWKCPGGCNADRKLGRQCDSD